MRREGSYHGCHHIKLGVLERVLTSTASTLRYLGNYMGIVLFIMDLTYWQEGAFVIFSDLSRHLQLNLLELSESLYFHAPVRCPLLTFLPYSLL
jgi:hypothetical protein